MPGTNGHTSHPPYDPEKYAPLHQVPSRLPVPLLSDKPHPWDDIRKLYVCGVVCGPGLPDRTEILSRIGQADVFEKKGSRNGSARRQIMRLGKFQVVFPDYYGVAAHFGVPTQHLIEKASEEDWAGLQKIYRAQLRQKAGNLRVQNRLANVEKLDERAYRVARQGLKMVAERLEMISETVEIIDGEVVTAMDVREMESLSRSAQVWHALGRRALGFPVDKVGVVAAGDAASMAEHGLMPGAIEDEPDEQLALLGITSGGIADSGGSVAELTGSTQTSITGELAKDDATRLHGFLTVLGRAQDASQTDRSADGHGLEVAPALPGAETEEEAEIA